MKRHKPEAFRILGILYYAKRSLKNCLETGLFEAEREQFEAVISLIENKEKEMKRRVTIGKMWRTRKWTELEYSIHAEEPSGDEYAEVAAFTDCYEEENGQVFGYSHTGVLVALID
jgi:hypothetical protein